jgi:ABC-type bacteriocin/lantibiotic exporter with double-glycine peptidase domain
MSDTNEKSMQKSTVQKKMVNESTASYGAAATKKRRSAISIMGSLIGLVKPLLHIMLAAIILGTAGYLCAIFLTILAGQVIVHGLIAGGAGSVKTIITLMLIIAVLRGILHYAEQYCNHFIAFKLLAIIRHKVFAALRKLCPAKLEGRDKGNLISIITTDIELLEVFYAHTIADCHCSSDFSGHGIFYRKISLAGGNSCAGSLSGRGSCDPYVERQVWKPDGNGISYKLRGIEQLCIRFPSWSG